MAPGKAKFLLIEGKRADRPSFFVGLTRKGYIVDSVPSGSSALVHLREFSPDMILVDAASMRTSGRRICQSLRQQIPGVPIVLILEKPLDNSETIDADLILYGPFTLQKLLNRIRPLMPVENKDLLQAGSLQLDVEQRWVKFANRQVSLTPRLVMLLKVLMNHPGEVIDREELFRKVWETAYTGDTRTLDVHISWLRQAIEDDPRHPRFIKTVRGVGYRLDIDVDSTDLLDMPGLKRV